MTTSSPLPPQVPSRYAVPAGEAQAEFTEKGSSFIGTAGPASTLEEAEAFIRRVSMHYADATHNAWAYLVGFGPAAVYACHNDGEPGGTAGPPALAALQGAGLGDVVVVVTRYFGGIKLGTGGLVRAYGRAARDAVAALPRRQQVARTVLSVRVAYALHDALRRNLEPYEAVVLDVAYADLVSFSLSVPQDRQQECIAAWIELTAGQAEIHAGA